MSSSGLASDRIIVALDYPDAASALALVASLGDLISFYKIGLQLFTVAGPDAVRQIKSQGKRIFLDLKFHDIPNTVAGAVRSAAMLGVDLLTIHASGGSAMMEAAVKAAQDSAAPRSDQTKILAVTVLTSMDAASLRSINLALSPAEQVVSLAKLAHNAGCGGVVCSPEEIMLVRAAIAPEMRIVVPGIRPPSSPAGDQSRTATPREAIARGADYLVIGRPITAAADPRAAAQAIAHDLGQQ